MPTSYPIRLKYHRLRMEKFVYEKGTNVALYNAEHTQEYKDAQDSIQKGIKVQLSLFDADKIHHLMLFTKSAAPPPDALVQAIAVTFGVDTLDAYINMDEYLQIAGTWGGQAAMDKMQINGVFTLQNQELLTYLSDHANLVIDSVDQTTQKWLADQIMQGSADGLTPQEIANGIADSSDQFSEARAKTIVLTETAAAITQVEIATSASYGITEKTWHTSEDDLVDEICGDLDDETVGINESFSSGDDGPPAHPNCRCYIDYPTPDFFNTDTAAADTTDIPAE